MTGRMLSVLGMIGLAVTLGSGCANQDTEDPRSAGRIQIQSRIAFEQGDYVKALDGFTTVLDRRPGSAAAQYDVGRTRLALGEGVAAREHLTIAHDLEPENPVYLDALADAMVATGELDELFGLLDRRAEEGDGIEGHLRTGRIAEKLGLVDEAEQAYLKAEALDVENSEAAQRALAELYRRAGDPSRELERLRVLLYFAPMDEEVRERVRALGEVPGPSLALRPTQLASP